MTTREAIGEGLTFEKVWAAIQATDEQLRKTEEHLDEFIRATREQMKVTDEQIKATGEQIKATGEQIKATGEQMKETNKRFGHFTNRFGEIVEYMVVPKLEEKFRDLGFVFEKVHRNPKFIDPEHGLSMQLDAFLENGSKAMVVEIKSKPTVEDIEDHVTRMEKLRRYADLHGDKRSYLGAVAGAAFGEGEKAYALQKGFYVIEPSGETFNITVPAGKYRPHEW
jgi:hypothetical protein